MYRSLTASSPTRATWVAPKPEQHPPLWPPNLNARLSLQCRLEMLNDAVLDAMVGLTVTLEFGLQTAIRAESSAIRRQNNLKRAAESLLRVQARGIDHEISLIYGLPGQTLTSFRESIQWCRDHNVKRVVAYPLMLLHGTPLYHQKEKLGLRESNDIIPIVVESPSFSRTDHRRMEALAANLGAGA